MNPEIKLTVPLLRESVSALKAGDRVLLSGRIIAARDAAHKRMLESLEKGEALPVSLSGEIIYYVGPTPALPGRATGSAGPTTAGRMDIYTPRLLDLGLLGMIGKGDRSEAVIEAIQRNCAVYFAATGGAGALLARQIKRYTVLAYPELGPEAMAELIVENFPLTVAIDSNAGNLYRSGPLLYAGK